MIGGKGNDKLWGEKGQDNFVFDLVATGDTLKDFNPNDDTILLAQSAFTKLLSANSLRRHFGRVRSPSMATTTLCTTPRPGC